MPDAPRTAAELAELAELVELLRDARPGWMVRVNRDDSVLVARSTGELAAVYDPQLLAALQLADIAAQLVACRRERDRYEAAWREAVAREAAGSAQGPVSEDEAVRRLR